MDPCRWGGGGLIRPLQLCCYRHPWLIFLLDALWHGQCEASPAECGIIVAKSSLLQTVQASQWEVLEESGRGVMKDVDDTWTETFTSCSNRKMGFVEHLLMKICDW